MEYLLSPGKYTTRPKMSALSLHATSNGSHPSGETCAMHSSEGITLCARMMSSLEKFYIKPITLGMGGCVGRELTLCVLEVVPPQWPDLVLATHIPHCEAYILVFHCFYIKTCKRNINHITQKITYNTKMSYLQLEVRCIVCAGRRHTYGGDSSHDFSEF